MIKATLIDDEPLALLQLEKMLEPFTSIKIMASFTEPKKAIKAIPDFKPNVIFLDIDMPEMNGIEVAEIIQNNYPEIEVVFITAYNTYAIEAFELNALDYILKPVHNTRLLKTVERLESRLSKETQEIIREKKIHIQCFQSLHFEYDGKPIQNFRWRTTKAQELFAYLLHHRNRFVSKELLIDLLWPEFEQKKALTHLYTTIYQIRQSLKLANIDISINNMSVDGGYMLDTQNVLIETELWERKIQKLNHVHNANYEEFRSLVDQYPGDYYGNYDYIWAENERQRLRSIWLQSAIQLADFYRNKEMIVDALTIYQRIIQLQPYFEEAHLGLMKAYDSLGERSAVENQYQMIRDLFDSELGIEIPERIKSWYKVWNIRDA